MNTLVLVESNTTGTGRAFCAAARSRGLRPVVLARQPSRYPYLAEDGIDHEVVDTSDVGEIIAACGRLAAVVGVTTSSELAVERAAEAARELGLPHPPVDAVRIARNKAEMRVRLREAGLPGPEFGVVRTSEDAVAVADRIGWPVVVKPVRGTGSEGVRLCLNAGDVGAIGPGPVLVESYLDGPECSVETFDGRPVVVVGKHLSAHPWFVETGHDLPAPIPAADRDAAAACVVAALRALGLTWGAAHVEVRLTVDGPRVVEINPRLAGGMIPAAIAAGFGVDLVDAVVAKAAGVTVDLDAAEGEAAIRFAVAVREGVAARISGVDQALRVPGVRDVVVRAAPGTDVRVRGSFQDRLGCVVAAGPGSAEAAERAVGLLRWETGGTHPQRL